MSSSRSECLGVATAGTKIRAAYGIEAARVILGHASVGTSEIYAEIDREKAKEIMKKLG